MRPLRSNAGSGRRGGVIFILALVLSLPILAVWLFRSRGRAPTGIRSLAVLPLDNLSGDPSQDYFADGMTDELIFLRPPCMLHSQNWSSIPCETLAPGRLAP